jgi:ferredoxin
MIKEIKIDQTSCVGCGNCTITAPKAFELSSRGVSQAKQGALSNDENVLLKAAQACPVKAISLISETQTKIYPKD